MIDINQTLFFFVFLQALESSYFTSDPPASKPEDIPRSAAPRHRHSRDPFHMNDASINDENLPSDYSHLNCKKTFIIITIKLQPSYTTRQRISWAAK